MSELVAVEGMTVAIDPATSIPPGATALAIVVNPIVGRKLKGSGAQAQLDGDTFTISGITAGAASIADPGPYDVAIPSTAAKMGSEGTKVLREGDLSELIEATPQTPGTPPVDTPVAFKCVITAAGQLKASAE